MNSPQTILIRVASPNDCSAISQIYKQSMQVICAADYTQEQIQALLKYQQPDKMNIWGNVFFVAEYGNTIVGFAGVSGSFITAVYVHPHWIRQGIGRQLLKAIETKAASRRYKRMFVIASLTGEPFYRACGYTVDGHTDLAVGRGTRVACVAMQKHLIKVSDKPQDRTINFWELAQWLLLILMPIYAIAKLLRWL